MGESKRRKESLGEEYGKDAKLYSWLPFTKAQGQQFMKVSTTAAWVGIVGMIAAWVVIRFIGPSFGWWTVS